MGERGPSIYLNWKAANEGKPVLSTDEYPMLTDANITGEVTEGYGPYKFINQVPIQNKPGLIQPVIILRLEFHLKNIVPDLSETNTEFFHGGGLTDEIAALISLALGVRFKSGGLTREFEPNGDPFGRPSTDHQPNPVLSFGFRYRGLILPGVVRSHSLEQLKPLSKLMNITPRNIIALIRAARLYQDALWIAESEPALAWLMFVSALETAADQWRRQRESAIARLEASKPKLLTLLKETGVSDLPEKVANLISDSLGATKKFTDFVLEFQPSPPIKRPAGWGLLDWSEKAMKKNLSKIYDHRSKALHGGTPFPFPMCMPPFILKEWEAYSEIPGGAMSGMGGTWLPKDIPMLLHTFEYITRGTLLNWWNHISSV
jgi:hypothetical protein